MQEDDEARADLGPALRRVLELVPEGEERSRFEALFVAASRAIDSLEDLDLSSLEHEGGAAGDQEVWEAVAPLVHGTIDRVNDVLVMVRERFPEAPPSAPLDADAAFDELFSQEPTPVRDVGSGAHPVRDAVAVIRAIADALAHDVTSFGEGIRRPHIAGNRFELLAHVREHRGKFRAGIGEMIHLAATAFADVHKEDVVPGYQADVEASLAIRRTVTMLAAAVRAENERIRLLSGDALRVAVRRVASDLDTFHGTPAGRLLRMQDRVSFAAARQDIEARLGSGDDAALRQVVEGLDKFLDSLSVINRREILIVHDRETVGAVVRQLERVESSLHAQRLEKARLELQGAHRAAQRLFGRDARLDAFLRGARRFDAAGLEEPALRSQAAALHEATAGVD